MFFALRLWQCIDRCFLQGLPTIRAYGAGPRSQSGFVRALDANGAWWFAYIATSRWIAYRLDAIAAVMLTAGALLAMAVHTKVHLSMPRSDEQ